MVVVEPGFGAKYTLLTPGCPSVMIRFNADMSSRRYASKKSVVVLTALLNHLLDGASQARIGTLEGEKSLGTLRSVEQPNHLAKGKKGISRSMHDQQRWISTEVVLTRRIHFWVAVNDYCRFDSRVPTAGIEKPEGGDGTLRMAR
jgi:hypothetical protein